MEWKKSDLFFLFLKTGSLGLRFTFGLQLLHAFETAWSTTAPRLSEDGVGGRPSLWSKWVDGEPMLRVPALHPPVPRCACQYVLEHSCL